MNYTIQIQHIPLAAVLAQNPGEDNDTFFERLESVKDLFLLIGVADDKESKGELRAVSDSFRSLENVLPKFLKDLGKQIVERELIKNMPKDRNARCTCHEKSPCNFCLSLSPEEFDIHNKRGPEGLHEYWNEKGL